MSEELAGGLDTAWGIFQKPILSIREIEVLRLIAEEKSNKEIGVLLSISVHTVENHRANIMNKLRGAALKGGANGGSGASCNRRRRQRLESRLSSRGPLLRSGGFLTLVSQENNVLKICLRYV